MWSYPWGIFTYIMHEYIEREREREETSSIIVWLWHITFQEFICSTRISINIILVSNYFAWHHVFSLQIQVLSLVGLLLWGCTIDVLSLLFNWRVQNETRLHPIYNMLRVGEWYDLRSELFLQKWSGSIAESDSFDLPSGSLTYIIIYSYWKWP